MQFDIDTNSEMEPEIVSKVNMNIVQESTDRTVIVLVLVSMSVSASGVV
jgi:hypothetical protein